MIKMKFFAVLMLLLISSIAVMAQGGRNRMTAEQQTEQMKTELKLTDEQVPLIDAINKKLFAQIDSVRQANTDRQEAMNVIRDLRQKTNEQYKKVLTAEQYELFLKKLKEKRQQGGGNHRN